MLARILWAFASLLALGMTGCNRPDLSTPKGAAKTFMSSLLKGELETANKASFNVDPGYMKAVIRAREHTKKLKAAAIARFGETAAKSIYCDFDNEGELKMLDESKEQISGDTATLSTSALWEFKLKKIEGSWKVDGPGSNMSGSSAAILTEMVTRADKNIEELTSEISGGKYRTATEAKESLSAKIKSTSKVEG